MTRNTSISLAAIALGLVAGCTAKPSQGELESQPSASKAEPTPVVAPAEAATAVLRGRIVVDAEPGSKRLQGVWLEVADGERLILAYRAEPWLAVFAGAEVNVTGERYAPEGQAVDAPHLRVSTIEVVEEEMADRVARIGPEIELEGRFVVDIGEVGTKSEGERTVEFAAADGRRFMLGNQVEGPMDRTARIRARPMEYSRYVAHAGGPRLWVITVDGEEPGAAAAIPKAKPSPQAAEPYAATKADLDGDGTPEAITVTHDGRVLVGAATHAFGWIHPTDDYWGGLDREQRLTIVQLDAKRRGVMLWQFEAGDVDPDKRYLLLGYREGKLERLTPADVPAAHAAEISVGVGRIAIVEDTCVRDATIGADGAPGKDGQSRRVVRTLRYDSAKASFVVREKKTTTRSGCLMAACPFVEVEGDLRGEILRRLSEPGVEGEQSLTLPSTAGPVVVTLIEAKPEWSWIDAVALRVDGRVVRPRECASIPAVCADDGDYLRLGPGERVSFAFDVGASDDVVLLVDGHYVPIEGDVAVR